MAGGSVSGVEVEVEVEVEVGVEVVTPRQHPLRPLLVRLKVGSVIPPVDGEEISAYGIGQ